MIDPDVLSAMDMIRDSARGLVPRGDLRRVRSLRDATPGFDRAIWREMGALGWIALRRPEAEGGAGLGILPYCALAEELGRGLVPEPLIPAVLAASLLEGDVLAEHLAGETLVLPAWQDARDDLAPQTDLEVSSGRLTATKRYVPMAAGADAYLVLGSDRAFLAPAVTAGITVTTAGTQDGGHVATIVFEGVAGSVIAIDPRPAFAEATLATAAYLLGLSEAALELTVAYLKTRVQFGRPIGQFQVLQHMAVDLKLEVEVTRASVEAAAALLEGEGLTAVAAAAVARAKARASSAAMRVTRDCIQLHGGIGFTDEHDIGLFLRKAMVASVQFGSADVHRAAFARLRPLEETA